MASKKNDRFWTSDKLVSQSFRQKLPWCWTRDFTGPSMTTTLIGLQTCSWVDLTGLATTTELSALEGRVSATELKANAAATATALNGVSTNLSTLTGRVTAVEGVAGAAATGASVTALTTRVTATEGVANAAAKQSDHTTLAGRVTATETKANAAATAASV